MHLKYKYRHFAFVGEADGFREGKGGKMKRVLAFENSGTWKTARFILPDPKFSNRQNGNTDLRINTRASQPLVIRGLTMKRLAQTKPF